MHNSTHSEEEEGHQQDLCGRMLPNFHYIDIYNGLGTHPSTVILLVHILMHLGYMILSTKLQQLNLHN